MDSTEIRNVAIDSASKYYNYLDINDKGMQEVRVHDILSLSDRANTYKLRLAAKLFDTDAIFFKLLTTGRRYSPAEIKILEYDADKHILIIKPEADLADAFKKITARDIQVISDLKFLIERVKKWFELNGAQVTFPVNSSIIGETLSQIQFLPGYLPSDNQRQSLGTIFQHPFSYVWGAPGTGKTQFVLAYAILHYLRFNKKVAIMAPTNNAIEQVLRGVIKMTDKAGVPRAKLLRLGVPSHRFAEEFPEVCEERGIQQKIDELDKQIARLTQLMNRFDKVRQWEKARRDIDIFRRWAPLEEKINEELQRVEQAREHYLSAKVQLDSQTASMQQIQADIKALQNKVNSLGNKVVKFFARKPTQSEIYLQTLVNQLIELTTRVDYWKGEVKEKENLFHLRQEHMSQREKELESLVAETKLFFSNLEELRPLVATLTSKNHIQVEHSLLSKIEEGFRKIQEDDGITGEYAHHSPEELEKNCLKLKAAREKLAASSTEERLKGVNVIACTLDGYVGRFTESKLLVDHVFVDEAGYANIIKALTVFSMQTPVTFLGDHMQLPPVCEINDQDIQRNPEYHNIFMWAQSAIFLEGLFSKNGNIMLQEYLSHALMRTERMQQVNLIHTFRFDNKLAHILDRHVYQNGFTSSLQSAETKIYFIHAEKREGLKSRVSQKEVHAIQSLLQQFDEDEDFIILTPYKKQVTALGNALPTERNDLKILTVHGSQGREWDTVILSVVDTADKWFVDSLLPISNGLNLINTAVSRTKKRLIVVCDSRYWKHQPGQLITDLLSNAQEMKVSLFA